jgi:hypothetical protein
MTDEHKLYSLLQVEAALCIWEKLLRDYDAIPFGADIPFGSYWRARGTAAMRHFSIALADYCLAVYDALTDDDKYGRPYDWEIIPAILDTLDWAVGPEIRLPPAEAAAIVARQLNANETP